MTSPSGEQQEQLLKTVYEKAGIDANEIDYIEAHGKKMYTHGCIKQKLQTPLSTEIFQMKVDILY